MRATIPLWPTHGDHSGIETASDLFTHCVAVHGFRWRRAECKGIHRLTPALVVAQHGYVHWRECP